MAVSLNGTNQCAVVAANTSLNLVTDFSVGAWIYPTGWGQGGYGRIMQFNIPSYSMWGLYLDSATDSLNFSALGGLSANSAAASIVLNTPYHVVCTVTAGKTAQVYLNGAPSGSAVANWTAQLLSGLSLGIGYRSAQNDRFFAGRIGDVWLMAHCMSAAEVAEAYAFKRLPQRYFTSGTVRMYLPLMGPTGAAVDTAHWGTKDLSGNGNSVASVNSAPVWADDPLPPQAWVDGWFGGAGGVAVGGAIYRPRPQYTYRMGPRMILGGVI